MIKTVLHRRKLVYTASRLYFLVTAIAAMIALSLFFLES